MLSFLDNDLYKFTMQQAVIQKFPRAQVRYKLINRGETKFSERIATRLGIAVQKMAETRLDQGQAKILARRCPYLTPPYIDFLMAYQYNPSEIYITQDKGDLSVEIEGPWYRTILWEVPLMAMISELHFEQEKVDLTEQAEKATEKYHLLADKGIKFADFGTRRRFSRAVHKAVISSLSNCGESFVGTSNIKLAIEHNIKPIGTQAHEWTMFHGAVYGYRRANYQAMMNWADVYQGQLGIALSDTFTTKAFKRSFRSPHAYMFDGVRHDSGDPIKFAVKMASHYEQIGIKPSDKTIVFSDGLTVTKAIEIEKKLRQYPISRPFKSSYGIGTHLTNDVPGVKPLNIVIKMTECRLPSFADWAHVVKLSDIEDKHTGDPEEIEICKRTLSI